MSYVYQIDAPFHQQVEDFIVEVGGKSEFAQGSKSRHPLSRGGRMAFCRRVRQLNPEAIIIDVGGDPRNANQFYGKDNHWTLSPNVIVGDVQRYASRTTQLCCEHIFRSCTCIKTLSERAVAERRHVVFVFCNSQYYISAEEWRRLPGLRAHAVYLIGFNYKIKDTGTKFTENEGEMEVEYISEETVRVRAIGDKKYYQHPIFDYSAAILVGQIGDQALLSLCNNTTFEVRVTKPSVHHKRNYLLEKQPGGSQTVPPPDTIVAGPGESDGTIIPPRVDVPPSAPEVPLEDSSLIGKKEPEPVVAALGVPPLTEAPKWTSTATTPKPPKPKKVKAEKTTAKPAVTPSFVVIDGHRYELATRPAAKVKAKTPPATVVKPAVSEPDSSSPEIGVPPSAPDAPVLPDTAASDPVVLSTPSVPTPVIVSPMAVKVPRGPPVSHLPSGILAVVPPVHMVAAPITPDPEADELRDKVRVLEAANQVLLDREKHLSGVVPSFGHILPKYAHSILPVQRSIDILFCGMATVSGFLISRHLPRLVSRVLYRCLPKVFNADRRGYVFGAVGLAMSYGYVCWKEAVHLREQQRLSLIAVRIDKRLTDPDFTSTSFERYSRIPNHPFTSTYVPGSDPLLYNDELFERAASHMYGLNVNASTILALKQVLTGKVQQLNVDSNRDRLVIDTIQLWRCFNDGRWTGNDEILGDTWPDFVGGYRISANTVSLISWLTAGILISAVTLYLFKPIMVASTRSLATRWSHWPFTDHISSSVHVLATKGLLSQTESLLPLPELAKLAFKKSVFLSTISLMKSVNGLSQWMWENTLKSTVDYAEETMNELLSQCRSGLTSRI
jgi:hypothetical protein